MENSDGSFTKDPYPFLIMTSENKLHDREDSQVVFSTQMRADQLVRAKSLNCVIGRDIHTSSTHTVFVDKVKHHSCHNISHSFMSKICATREADTQETLPTFGPHHSVRGLDASPDYTLTSCEVPVDEYHQDQRVIDTQSLELFHLSHSSKVLAYPVPARLFKRSVLTFEDVHLTRNVNDLEWAMIGQGPLILLMIHDPGNHSCVNEIRVQLCDTFTYAPVWYGTITLPQYVDIQLKHPIQMNEYHLGQLAEKVLYGSSQNCLINVKHYAFVQHKLHWSDRANDRTINKSKLTSKWSTVRIQSTSEEPSHTEYLICRMEFATVRHTESLQRRLEALCKQAQWWITKYLVRFPTIQTHQLIDRKRPKGHPEHKTTRKQNRTSRKRGGTRADSISAPCMFRHIRTITEEETKILT